MILDPVSEILSAGQSHLLPLAVAARDHQIPFLFLPPDAGRIRFPHNMRPFTVLVADDDGTSRGAAAFDRDSLRRIVAKADIAIINAWALHPPVYSLAAGLAVALRQSVIIVETRLAHEQEWIDFLHARNREIQFSIITPVGGSA